MGLFQPLSIYYSIKINKLIDEIIGTIRITKGLFWPRFKIAFDKAFTKENIQSAFRKSGIWPIDRSIIIKTITRPTLSLPEKAQELHMPKTSKAIRRFQLAYNKEL